MAEEKPEIPGGKGISRRSFLKGLAATGAVMGVLSSRARLAKADSFGPYLADELPKEKLLWMHECMLKARYFDVLLSDVKFKNDPAIEGRTPTLHPCPGEEAIAVGVCAAMRPNDWCYTTHRGTMHNIARGMDMGKMFATAIYKASGYTRGHGNHFHISDKSHKVPNIEGLIGLAPVIAAGTAYGEMLTKSGNIVVKFSGDGDFNEGDTLVALNESALFKLPIVFICENNGQQISIRTDETMTLRDVADRGRGFGIPGFVVDGQDPLAIYSVAKPAIDRARAGEGPSIIECKTFRYFDHAGNAGYDPARGVGSMGLSYRSDNEVRNWLAKDPIELFARVLIAREIVTPAQEVEMRAKAKAEVQKAWEWAAASPNCKAEDALIEARVGENELPRQLADCPLFI